MDKFAFCKCFYVNNIYIRSWNRHITFKSEGQFREDFKSCPKLELALVEAEAEIARRMYGRDHWRERREKIAQNYSPILSNKLASFTTGLEQAQILEAAFKDASKLCERNDRLHQLPVTSKFNFKVQIRTVKIWITIVVYAYML